MFIIHSLSNKPFLKYFLLPEVFEANIKGA